MVQQRGNEIFISDSTRKKRETQCLKRKFNLLYELKESKRFALCYRYELKILYGSFYPVWRE